MVSALIKILRPIIRILLRKGVSHQTFSDIAKWVYVDIAKKEFAIPGKKVSDSRISVISGLTRQEVKRLSNEESPEEFKAIEKHHRAVSIVNAWMYTKEYQDSFGEPAEIPFKGDDISFEALVKKYGRDITPRPVFDELVRSESIEQLPNEMIRLKKSVLFPKTDEDEKIALLGMNAGALINTIIHNIDNSGKKDLLQLSASSLYLSKEKIPYIRNEIKRKGIVFLQEIDEWLISQEIDPQKHSSAEYFEGGLSMFYYEEKDKK